MELTPGQQRLLFVVIVLALAGLGIYLIGGRRSGGTPAAAPSPTASTATASTGTAGTGTASTGQPSPSGTETASVPPSVVPPPTPVSTAGGAEIYQWLPFTPAGLTAAVKTTLSFATDYATWSYKESTAAYGAKFKALAAPPEIATLEEGYGTVGLAQARTATKQVSTGSGTIDQISSFGTGPTITFLVTITNRVTSTQPTTTQSPQFSVTVVSSAGAWQVNNIELSSLGNQ